MKYSLYKGEYKNIRNKYRFYDGNSLLVYSDKRPNGKWNKIPLEQENDLTDMQKQWLMQCKIEINAKAVKENKEKYYGFLSEFLNNFEKGLDEYERKQTSTKQQRA